jgi:hypothetical protein
MLLASGRPKGSRSKYDWHGTILDAIRKHVSTPLKPSIRGTFYHLKALKLIDKSKNVYKSLDRYCSKWRDEGILGLKAFTATDEKTEIFRPCSSKSI